MDLGAEMFILLPFFNKKNLFKNENSNFICDEEKQLEIPKYIIIRKKNPTKIIG